MLRKLVYIASILVFVGAATVSAEELTPLQRKVREAFNKMHEAKVVEVKEVAPVLPVEEVKPAAKVEKKTKRTSKTNKSVAVKQTPVVEEKAVVVEALAAQDTDYDNVILATDQDNDIVSSAGEDDEFVVIHAPKKRKSALKTAFQLSEKQRTAKINNRWSVSALGWNSELTGHVKISENDHSVVSDELGKIDIGRDIKGLDKKTVPGLKLTYKANDRSTIHFSWTKVDMDGRLGVSKTFKGITYNADADIKLKNSMYDLFWAYRLWREKDSKNTEKSYVSGIFGVKASSMKFNLHSDLEGSTSYSETFPVPYLGFEFGSNIANDWYFKANVRYLKLNNIKDYDAKHCDFDAAVSYKVPNQDLFVDVGYRQVMYDVDGKGNDVKLKYKGPYVGVEYRF